MPRRSLNSHRRFLALLVTRPARPILKSLLADNHSLHLALGMAILHLRGLEMTYEHRPFPDATAALAWLSTTMKPLALKSPSLRRLLPYMDSNRYLQAFTNRHSLRGLLAECRRRSHARIQR